VDIVVVTELPKAGTVVRSITATPPERLRSVYLEAGLITPTWVRRGGPGRYRPSLTGMYA
jgi:hypothetical protein